MSEKIGGITAGEDEDGKAVFEFDGKITSTDPLLTTAQDVIGAINELFLAEPEGGGFNGNFRALIDADGDITVVVGEIPEGETEERYTDYLYAVDIFTYSEEIKTTKTDGDTTSTTTEAFEKRIVTAAYNARGEVILRTDFDENTGVINGYYDGSDMPIYLTEWRTTV